MLGTVDEIVIDCADPHRLATFWAAVLGGDVHDRDSDWSYLLPPGWTQLSFQRVPETKQTKNRLHIDIAVPDLTAAAEQAVALGARLVGTVQRTAGGTFHTLLDPEDNEWCIVRPTA